MKKIILVPIIIVIVGIIIVGFSAEPTKEKTVPVFHATLADPTLYSNGIYNEKFTIDSGEYSFRFVPNGSSPQVLSITLSGEKFNFVEEFKLDGTLHQTGISEYFTWDYLGEKNIIVSDVQELSITIDPNGNVMGSVTVDIIEI